MLSTILLIVGGALLLSVIVEVIWRKFEVFMTTKGELIRGSILFGVFLVIGVIIGFATGGFDKKSNNESETVDKSVNGHYEEEVTPSSLSDEYKYFVGKWSRKDKNSELEIEVKDDYTVVQVVKTSEEKAYRFKNETVLVIEDEVGKTKSKFRFEDNKMILTSKNVDTIYYSVDGESKDSVVSKWYVDLDEDGLIGDEERAIVYNFTEDGKLLVEYSIYSDGTYAVKDGVLVISFPEYEIPLYYNADYKQLVHSDGTKEDYHFDFVE